MKRELKRENGTVYAEISYDEENGWIFLNWDGYIKVDMVKEGSEELLNVIKEKNVSKVLVSNENVTGPWQQANEWAATDWNPRAVEAGLRYMAIIQSDNVFAQLSSSGFEKITTGVYTVKNFQTEKSASDWLKSVE